MAWLAVFLFIGVLGLTAVILSRVQTRTEDAMIWGAAAVLCGFINIVVTGFASIHVVDARNVGVVKSFGSIVGQVGEGVNLTWPWQTVEEWNVRLQVIEPDTSCENGRPRCLDAGSIDVQDVYVEVALNMEVDPRDVQNLARNVGSSYIDTVVRNRMEQVTKAVISQYKAESILSKREEIRSTITERMRGELAPYSISVTDFLITNLSFTKGFSEAIEAKVKAEQEALTEQNRVAIAEAQSRQKAATAEGEANRLRIEAQGQADANHVISQSLTPQLIQFQAVQKLSDNISLALVPPGSNFILDGLFPTK